MPQYEITITVSPVHQVSGMRYSKMIASKQWEFLQFFVYETLKKHNIQYQIFPEFHKNMNLHIHGHAVLPDDINKMDIIDILKRFNQIGRSRFQPVSNLTSWLQYIEKDHEELKYSYKSPNYNHLYYLDIKNGGDL